MSAQIDEEIEPGQNRRYWPRMNGGVTVLYRSVPEKEWLATSKKWMSSIGPAPFGAGFHAPDPFMEFSAGGLCFHDVARLREGDHLILSIGVPPSSTAYHVTGKVVRVSSIPEEEQEASNTEGGRKQTRRVAVEFLDIPQRATQALIEYTERLQDFEIMTTADIITADITGIMDEE